MKTFGKIYIRTINGNIDIQDGSFLQVSSGGYRIENNCLIITANNDDISLTVPVGAYEIVNIQTINGDGFINLNDSSIGRVEFTSISGDLVINGNVDDLDFQSINGSISHQENKKVLKVKETASTHAERGEVWRNGERYK